MKHETTSPARSEKHQAAQPEWLVQMPASRTHAITRGLIWAVPTALFTAIGVSIYSALDFSPTGVSNRLVEYGFGVFALVFPAGALWAAIKSLRWMLMGCWPAPVGVFANDRELILALGPAGTKKFDVARLNIQYAFELTDELTEEGYEAYLPEEEQMRLFLPRMTHPLTAVRIDQLILDYVQRDEETAATALRPAIDQWRSQRATRSEPENQD